MTTYAEYMMQIAELQALAEEARRKELDEARAKIRQLMQAHGIAADELNETPKKSSKVQKSVAPKYRDPETGKTWSGRGRAPTWLKGRNKEEFVIN